MASYFSMSSGFSRIHFAFVLDNQGFYRFLLMRIHKDPKLKLPFKHPLYTLGTNIMAFLNEAKYGIILSCHLEK